MQIMTDKNNKRPERIAFIVVVLFFVIMVAVSVVLHFVTHKNESNTFEETTVQIDYKQVSEKPKTEYVYFAIGDGDKYHVEGCPSVRENSERVPVSQKQIDKGNYTACKKCIE